MSGEKIVLVIDDDTDLQQLIKITLKSAGYQVATAGNGVEGLAQLETLKPDLIILDINMPRMGGIEFYQKIYDKDRALYPVLVLTARANMEHLFRDLNVDGFIDKPFEIDELLAEVKGIIKTYKEMNGRIAGAQEPQPLKICVVENDRDTFNQIGAAFTDAGYVVAPIRYEAEAAERISSTMPDAVLVRLELFDLPWEITVTRLKSKVKNRNIKFILYARQTAEKTAEQMIAMKKLDQKEEIDCCVVYSDVGQLVDSVNELLNV